MAKVQMHTTAAPGISPRYEEGKRGWMSLDNSVTFSNYTGVRNYRKEAKSTWQTLDNNNDGTVDEREITKWCIDNRVLAAVTDEDGLNIINKLFDDIDTDGNGSLDFDEFCTFYTMIQHEKTQMQVASRHHITALPPSIVKFNKKAFTTDAIEILLQEKIQQFTSQDSDRFRQILTMFKTQVQRAKDHQNSDNDVMGVNLRQFNVVLMWLGLFATQKQAKQLFNKYDANGDGVLTVHEFLTQARPTDYPGRQINVGEKYSFRTGKRMFLKDTLNGKPVRPNTPNDDVFHVSERTIAERIRAKMGNFPGTGQHYNETPLALNDLMKKFQFYDPREFGECSKNNLKRALQNLNLSMGETHLELLMDKFAGENGGFNYPKFCFYVFPGKPQNAALPEHTSLQLRKPAYNMNMKLDFGATSGAPSQRSQRSQHSQRSQPQPSSRISSRSMNARLAHSQRLQPLNRSLTPSASMASLNRGGSRGSRRGLSASASQPYLSGNSRRG